LNFSALISEMLSLINTSIPKQVKLQLSLPFNLPWIEADASQIQQIVMNLVINGAEAIGPEGGTVRVSTGVSGVGADKMVFMEVQDSGSGMSEATKAKIFDPFFTTKTKGRGLGLAAVSGIIRGHNGKMEVDTVIGEGTTFKVFFPAVEPSAETPEVSSSAECTSGRGTILVVDDEPLLRDLAKTTLEQCGYSVLVAENGLEGVNTFRENPSGITAVLLDLTMPVMSGEEAFHLIREIRKDVPVLISSGYGEFFARKQFGPADVVSFLQKPYTAAKLAKKLSQVITSGQQQNQ
jgi:CheY-like chemotaxis protein